MTETHQVIPATESEKVANIAVALEITRATTFSSGLFNIHDPDLIAKKITEIFLQTLKSIENRHNE